MFIQKNKNGTADEILLQLFIISIPVWKHARVDFVKYADISIALNRDNPGLKNSRFFLTESLESEKNNSAKDTIIFILHRKCCDPFLIERISVLLIIFMWKIAEEINRNAKFY